MHSSTVLDFPAHSMKQRCPNKGHEELINQFFASIKQPVFKAPISVERLNMVADLTLIIDALACEGGGKKELSF